MKQQLSPQKLFEDFKKDWPQWQQALRQLPAAIENAAQTKTPTRAANTNPVSNTSHKLGSTAILVSLSSIAAEQNELIQLGNAIHAMPWIGIVGLVLVFLKRSS